MAGLRPSTCWGCVFEFRCVHGCLSVVSVVCCQVEISATDRSLVQRSNNRLCLCVFLSVINAPVTPTPAMSKQKSSDLRKKEKNNNYPSGSVNVDPVIVYTVQCCTLPGSTEIHSTCSPSRIEGHFVELHFVFVRVAYFRTSLVQALTILL